MRDYAAHFAESGRVGPRVPPEFKNAGNPAHLEFLRVGRRTLAAITKIR
jgi:hypothetical protein